MSDNLSMPSGMGGLLRYNEEYSSKLMLKPGHVLVFVILVILASFVLRILFPMS